MTSSDRLREQAEQRLSISRADIRQMTAEDIHKLLYELQVHQIELELQNEELRDTQAELASAHDRYSDLYEFAPVGYVTLDRKGSILAANLTLAAMLGVDRGALTRTQLSGHVGRESRQTLKQYLLAVFGDGANENADLAIRKLTCDLELETAHGSTLHARLQSELVGNDTAEAAFCRATISDITVQKIAELKTERFNEELEQEVARRTAELAVANRELLTSRERLSMILNAAADAIITIDKSGIVQHVNRASTEMFGYSVEELEGQELAVLMPRECVDKHYMGIQRALEKGLSGATSRVGEVTGQRKDGTNFQADLTVTDVPELGLFTGIMRDLTEQKCLQREVLSIAAREQQRIGADLHDGLCQELAGIAMLVDALALSELPSMAVSQANSIARKLRQAVRHTRDIAHGLVPVELDAEGLMAALTRLSNQYQETPDITCSFECPAPVLISNNQSATHLYHMAQEACRNAVRHAKPSRLRITLAQSDEGILLRIVDDGCGIDAEHTSQMDDGLGFQIMRYRAGLLGGQVTIEKRSDQAGTSVSCFIPQDLSSRAATGLD